MSPVTYGGSSFFAQPIHSIDRFIYSNAIRHNFVPRPVIENYLQYAPVIIAYGVNLVGIHGKNSFVDRTLIYALSQGLLNLTVFSLKNTTGRLRPNGLDHYSFPSGHTANAFAGAEFLAQELGHISWVYSFLGYAFATTTGIFRIYHENHWFSDAVAGAGFGILATKGAYLLYPLLRNPLSRKRAVTKPVDTGDEGSSKAHYILLPSYANGIAGLLFSAKF